MADYIPREAAKRLICRFCDMDYSAPCSMHENKHIRGGHAEGCNRLLAFDYQIPAADVAPVVHAHWEDIIDDVDMFNVPHGRCPVCHAIRPIDNYCGNCGTRMDESEGDGE